MDQAAITVVSLIRHDEHDLAVGASFMLPRAAAETLIAAGAAVPKVAVPDGAVVTAPAIEAITVSLPEPGSAAFLPAEQPAPQQVRAKRGNAR